MHLRKRRVFCFHILTENYFQLMPWNLWIFFVSMAIGSLSFFFFITFEFLVLIFGIFHKKKDGVVFPFSHSNWKKKKHFLQMPQNFEISFVYMVIGSHLSLIKFLFRVLNFWYFFIKKWLVFLFLHSNWKKIFGKCHKILRYYLYSWS